LTNSIHATSESRNVCPLPEACAPRGQETRGAGVSTVEIAREFGVPYDALQPLRLRRGAYDRRARAAGEHTLAGGSRSRARRAADSRATRGTRPNLSAYFQNCRRVWRCCMPPASPLRRFCAGIRASRGRCRRSARLQRGCDTHRSRAASRSVMSKRWPSRFLQRCKTGRSLRTCAGRRRHPPLRRQWRLSNVQPVGS